MSRSMYAGRGRAPKPSGAILAARFDGYPYLISRIGASPLRHIALVPPTGHASGSSPWPENRPRRR
jgi:hypothetical protein